MSIFSYAFYSYSIFINIMGRKKLRTKEEKRKQVNNRMKNYYQRHKDKIKQKNLKRYYENKRNLQNNQ